MNKSRIRIKVMSLLSDSVVSMIDNIDKALISGAIDADSYDGGDSIPQAILIALLREETDRAKSKTSLAIKKEASNIQLFL